MSMTSPTPDSRKEPRETTSTTSLMGETDTDASTIDTHEGAHLKRQSRDIRSTNDDSTDVDIEETRAGMFAILVVCCAAVGGFMFGYDTACISSILVFLDQPRTNFQLSSEQKELVTGITSVGSFFGSISASQLADWIGRKKVITICCVVFTLAAVQLSLCGSVLSMVFGRFVVGLAVGAASMVVPVYISEIAPSKQRGRLLVINSITTTGGQFVANFVAYLIANNEHNWRLMFFLSGIPPLLFLVTAGFIPESPRYLVLGKDYTKAEQAIAKLYPNATHSQVHTKVVSIMDDIELNEDKHGLPLHTRLFGSPATRRALAVGCGLMFYQQMSSFNSFMYYGATIFQSVGVGNPLVVSMLISGTNFCFTFVALKYIDIVGRRAMLLRTVWIMSVALFVAAFAFLKVDGVMSSEMVKEVSLDFYSVLLIIAVLTFVAGYASALGTVPWSSVEFLPLEARAPGSALIAATGWITNSALSASYLSLVNLLSETWTCAVFATVCLGGWFAIRMWYPEVNGLSLEEVRRVFEDGIDVYYTEVL